MEGDRAVIIGSGNVATHLARAISHAGSCRIAQVYSPNPGHAKTLADTLPQCNACSDFERIDREASIYIISVKDDAIADVADNLYAVIGDSNATVMHTSGSVDIDTLTDAGLKHCAVLYPLQTFSKNVDVDMSEVPFFIEGSDFQAAKVAAEIASSVSSHVFDADSSQRAQLHIAAVFGCNFVNFMLDIADNILEGAGYDINVLRPLLDATIKKAFANSPHDVQTGPAVRADMKIIDKHTEMLDGDPREIYSIVSQAIINSHANTNPL